MTTFRYGPPSPHFQTLTLDGGMPLSLLASAGAPVEMIEAVADAPTGDAVCWGIPWEIEDVLLVRDKPATAKWRPRQARWLVVMHTMERILPQPGPGGFVSPMRGEGHLGAHAADYVFLYADGEEVRVPIRCRREIGSFRPSLGRSLPGGGASPRPPPGRPGPGQTGPLGRGADAGWLEL